MASDQERVNRHFPTICVLFTIKMAFLVLKRPIETGRTEDVLILELSEFANMTMIDSIECKAMKFPDVVNQIEVTSADDLLKIARVLNRSILHFKKDYFVVDWLSVAGFYLLKG